MRRKKRELKYKKERVVFSDVLPYETPLIFSNRHFYNFLLKHKIRIENNKLCWDKNISDSAFESLKILFGLDSNTTKTNGALSIEKQKIKIPFSYRIAHKQDKFRELAIIHPLNQLQMVEFYEKYKYLILHYCSQSNFSIRRPDKVACYFYYKDRLHEQLLGKKVDSKEEYMNEYENLKSYFSYQKYSNIYKFYEDYRYQRAEKKFNKLLKFDIQDCFNSIYTHSIVWATLGGKEQAKSALVNKQSNKDTFGDFFDDLMQKMNHNETNGIVIGPEFSRIFAEIILQRIDKDVEINMISRGKYLKKDYECYRYVDDYFLFYNDEDTKNLILEQFALRLREYKLTISDSKTQTFEKPFVTDVTIAKQKIDSLFADNLKLKIENDTNSDTDTDELDIKDTDKKDDNKFSVDKLSDFLAEKRSLHINPNIFNAKYKAIIKETSVEYKSVVNYSLAKICSKLEILLKKFNNRFKYLAYYAKYTDKLQNKNDKAKVIKLKKQDEKTFITFIVNVLDIIFFLYSNNKRINTTLKVLSILNVIILYLKNNYQLKNEKMIRFDKANIEIVFKKIQDEINLVMQTTKFNDNTQLEAFYLLIALKEMGNEYGISAETINKYLNIKAKTTEKECAFWNMLLISVLLHYYSDNTEYSESLGFLKEVIKEKIKGIDRQQRNISAELTLLKMDILTCPYLDENYKKEVLELFDIADNQIQTKIINFAMKQKLWFIKWKGFNMNYEVNAKVSQEVYS